jgi:acetate kinase
LGVEIDDERNDVKGEERLISSDNSKIKVYVVPTDEELMIAKQTLELIK